LTRQADEGVLARLDFEPLKVPINQRYIRSDGAERQVKLIHHKVIGRGSLVKMSLQQGAQLTVVG